MPDLPLTTVLHYLRRRVEPEAVSEASDARLVERFVTARDEAAFEALVRRHGPMVLGLCRGLLRDVHRADDAFQATFLVFARKATSIHKRQSVASWLYGVAYRTALRVRAQAAQQRLHERQVPVMPSCEPALDLDRQELCQTLHQELQRLPEKYRAPLVHCYLQGQTTETAARELGWPAGSMGKRLARGRELLRERLASRGVGLSALLVGSALAESAAPAAVSMSLLTSTLKAAPLFAAGQAVAGAVPASVAALAEGVLHTMATTKLKMLAAVLFVLTLVGGGLGLFALPSLARLKNEEPVALPKDPQAVVLTWDHWRADLPRMKDAPALRILADGTVQANDPHGPGIAVQAKLSAAELQELLRFAVREQGFFKIEQRQLQERLRPLPGGAPPPSDDVRQTRTSLRVQADGREHEIRCPDLRLHAEDCSEARQLLAILERLEHLRAWAYAGGQEGLAASLRLANEELRRQFPEAPLLKADDLQAALQQANGTAWLNLERRGVASDGNPYSFIYARLEQLAGDKPQVTIKADLSVAAAEPQKDGNKKGAPDLTPKTFAEDPTIKLDYPIVYVRVPRPPEGDDRIWMNTHPAIAAPRGSELMLWRPDGKEEVLVPVQEHEAICDPYVSFDGEWVYYVKFHDVSKRALVQDYGPHTSAGSDIYKVHVPTRKIVQLTHGELTANTGTLKMPKSRAAVCNLGPCPVPGGKVAFTSDRNAFRAVHAGQPWTQQLFVMDDDGSNVECIGHLNLGTALHPTILKDGRLLFSTVEKQGLRGTYHQWGIWSIHPDGTNWGPVVSAIMSGALHHFQTQISDGRIVSNLYYPGQSAKGFGTFEIYPAQAPEGYPAFGPGNPNDPRNRIPQGGEQRGSFVPYGMRGLTPFANTGDNDIPPNNGLYGMVAHPAGAPDNHLLMVWAGMRPLKGRPYNRSERPSSAEERFDAGIYLVKSGRPVEEPGQLVLIKNDPKYHEIQPRALVPYKRIYGVTEPARLVQRNDGKRCPHLPEGTPYGLMGTSSLYKRESFPYGSIPAGGVTAVFSGNSFPSLAANDPWKHLGGIFGGSPNFVSQGADAALYGNDEIHAIRILMLEPVNGLAERRFFAQGSGALERFRVLGEFPVRKFKGGVQPLDPDGNPDTSFQAKLPADVALTLQTLDKHGMVLNMAQTWHQVRPGEIRNDCGGCHAHSQKPTLFKDTAAARPDYPVWDLTAGRIPLLTSKKNDQSGKQWDTDDQSGVRWHKGNVADVEYFRDVKPILERSCVACHTQKSDKPAGELVLDDDQPVTKGQGPRVGGGPFPGTYFRLAQDGGWSGYNLQHRFGRRSPYGYWSGGAFSGQVSRYIRVFQSRRGLLAWKIFGKRLDGFQDQDFTTETVPGDASTLQYQGRPVVVTNAHLVFKDDPKKQAPPFSLTFSGSIMPPPEAVAGTYAGPDGKKIKVAPLTEEDRFTLVRWIDLGCPIDLAYDPKNPEQPGRGGWLEDDQRPTLTLTYPQPGVNEPLTRILIGMCDVGTGLDMTSFAVTADFAVNGVAAGENLAAKFQALPDSRWELRLAQPIAALAKGRITVSVKDKQGNITRVERTFSVGQPSRKSD
jgi:RNA polymerase sigma factor (sigma-70 family)